MSEHDSITRVASKQAVDRRSNRLLVVLGIVVVLMFGGAFAVAVIAMNSAADNASTAQKLADQVRSLGQKPVVAPPEDGQQGAKGDQGAPGANGVRGPQGRTGATGHIGPQGQKGSAGQSGTPGASGKDGSDGLNGQDGKDGKDGKQGEQGDAGKQGPKGDTGPAGPAGKDGARGPIGPAGADGSNGRGIQSVTFDCSGVGTDGVAHITYTDGTSEDAPIKGCPLP